MSLDISLYIDCCDKCGRGELAAEFNITHNCGTIAPQYHYMITLYSDEKDTMIALTKFLNDNRGKALYFDTNDTEKFDINKYTDYGDLVSKMEKITCHKCQHVYMPDIFNECPVCNLGNEYQS